MRIVWGERGQCRVRRGWETPTTSTKSIAPTGPTRRTLLQVLRTSLRRGTGNGSSRPPLLVPSKSKLELVLGKKRLNLPRYCLSSHGIHTAFLVGHMELDDRMGANRTIRSTHQQRALLAGPVPGPALGSVEPQMQLPGHFSGRDQVEQARGVPRCSRYQGLSQVPPTTVLVLSRRLSVRLSCDYRVQVLPVTSSSSS